MRGLFAHCRPGFERECGAELTALARARDVPGDVRATAGSGCAVFEAAQGADTAALALWKSTSHFDVVFARQIVGWFHRIEGDGAPDLATAVAAGLGAAPVRRFSSLWVEAPDTDEGRRRWPVCRRHEAALAEALGGRLSPGSTTRLRLHVCLPAPGTVFLGVSDPARSSPWPLGIPRLRLPAAAPSRSALKLEEALLVFLTEEEAARRLRPDITAVDLGAAPGGWTWQLARRGVRVTAVDNGPLAPEVARSKLVAHVEADGYGWRPDRPVDWLVCDMVTAPQRVARLVGLWAAKGLCREALFNWKLPAGDRLAAVARSRQVLLRELERAGVRADLRVKHLYHDREEVTGHLRVTGREAHPKPPPASRRGQESTSAPAGRRRAGRATRARGKGARR